MKKLLIIVGIVTALILITVSLGVSKPFRVKKMPDKGIIYKSIGSLLMKSEKKKIVEDLRDRKELTTTIITVLTKQQSRAEERAKELQQVIQEKIKPSTGT